MLLELTLRNFAIIDELTVNFGEGLNILTGETGAGKSVIVDAINLILGEKASTDLIKSDKEEALIEALFGISKKRELKDKLISSGLESKGDEVVIKRVIPRAGRSRVYINGSIATFNLLEQIVEGLVDIFSQQEHQTLLKEERHLEVLDEFGGLGSLTGRVSELYKGTTKLKREIEELERDQKNKIEREDFLRFQCKEIDSVRLEPGEDERLEEERKKLANAERLFSVANEAYGILYEGEKAVTDVLKRIRNQIDEVAKIDASLVDVAKSIEKGTIEIQDAAFTLRGYASNISFDPQRLSSIEIRLEEIKKLKRKYGGSIIEILEKRKSLEDELGRISGGGERIEALKKDVEFVESELNNCARELSEKRRQAAGRLMLSVSKELGEVGIKGGKLLVEFEKKPISELGFERVSFLFSANPDEKPKPLTRVVSGGELSRIMLVLKEILARVEGGSVLIFDEADSGIGGAVAETVGRKIKNLSKRYQVICITHLPQVAKFADTHFRVTKMFRGNKTRVQIKALNYDERVEELGRMLGGIKVTEKTIEAAREMLKN
ncbi:MAG: DNA repair protein RecN [Candidatus Dadabacteria bacterium RBG_19FT_COMBO_40_33]|nr:MAG: DNA repair protein RecN [Candidatus Dadabacteria bacterium RBG_19FT_COMBO_40_33]